MESERDLPRQATPRHHNTALGVSMSRTPHASGATEFGSPGVVWTSTSGLPRYRSLQRRLLGASPQSTSRHHGLAGVLDDPGGGGGDDRSDGAGSSDSADEAADRALLAEAPAELADRVVELRHALRSSKREATRLRAQWRTRMRDLAQSEALREQMLRDQRHAPAAGGSSLAGAMAERRGGVSLTPGAMATPSSSASALCTPPALSDTPAGRSAQREYVVELKESLRQSEQREQALALQLRGLEGRAGVGHALADAAAVDLKSAQQEHAQTLAGEQALAVEAMAATRKQYKEQVQRADGEAAASAKLLRKMSQLEVENRDMREEMVLMAQRTKEKIHHVSHTHKETHAAALYAHKSEADAKHEETKTRWQRRQQQAVDDTHATWVAKHDGAIAAEQQVIADCRAEIAVHTQALEETTALKETGEALAAERGSALESTSAELTEAQATLANVRDRAAADVHRLEEAAAASDRTRQVLTSQVEQLQADLLRGSTKFEGAFQQRLSEANEWTLQKEAEVASLSADLSATKSQLQATAELREQEQSKAAADLGQLRAAEVDKSALAAKLEVVSAAAEASKQFECEAAALRAELTSAQTKVQDAATASAALQASVASLEQRAERLDRELTEQRDAASASALAVSQLQLSATASGAKLAELGRELEASKLAMTAAQAAETGERELANSLQASLEKATAESEAQFAAVSAEVVQAKAALETSRVSEKALMERLMASLADYTTTLTATHADNERLQIANVIMDAEIAKLESSLQAVRAEAQSSAVEVSSLSAEKKHVDAAHEELQAELARLTAAFGEERASLKADVEHGLLRETTHQSHVQQIEAELDAARVATETAQAEATAEALNSTVIAQAAEVMRAQHAAERAEALESVEQARVEEARISAKIAAEQSVEDRLQSVKAEADEIISAAEARVTEAEHQLSEAQSQLAEGAGGDSVDVDLYKKREKETRKKMSQLERSRAEDAQTWATRFSEQQKRTQIKLDEATAYAQKEERHAETEAFKRKRLQKALTIAEAELAESQNARADIISRSQSAEVSTPPRGSLAAVERAANERVASAERSFELAKGVAKDLNRSAQAVRDSAGITSLDADAHRVADMLKEARQEERQLADTRVAALEQQLAEAAGSLKELLAAIDAERAALAKAAELTAEKVAELEAKDSEIGDLKANLSELSSELSIATAQFAELSGAHTELSGAASKDAKGLAHVDSLLDQVRKQKMDLMSRLADSEKHCEQLRENNQALVATSDQGATQLSGAQSKLLQAEKEKVQLAETLGTLSSELKLSQRDHSSLQRTHAEAQAQIASIERTADGHLSAKEFVESALAASRKSTDDWAREFQKNMEAKVSLAEQTAADIREELTAQLVAAKAAEKATNLQEKLREQEKFAAQLQGDAEVRDAAVKRANERARLAEERLVSAKEHVMESIQHQQRQAEHDLARQRGESESLERSLRLDISQLQRKVEDARSDMEASEMALNSSRVVAGGASTVADTFALEEERALRMSLEHEIAQLKQRSSRSPRSKAQSSEALVAAEERVVELTRHVMQNAGLADELSSESRRADSAEQLATDRLSQLEAATAESGSSALMKSEVVKQASRLQKLMAEREGAERAFSSRLGQAREEGRSIAEIGYRENEQKLLGEHRRVEVAMKEKFRKAMRTVLEKDGVVRTQQESMDLLAQRCEDMVALLARKQATFDSIHQTQQRAISALTKQEALKRKKVERRCKQLEQQISALISARSPNQPTKRATSAARSAAARDGEHAAAICIQKHARRRLSQRELLKAYSASSRSSGGQPEF